MRLTSYHLADLRAVRAGELTLTSAGFEFDGSPVDEASRDRLDFLWMNDFIDADVKGQDVPAVLELTGKGGQELARAGQESKR